MRVLVTGATGFAGTFLISHLLASGDTVFAAGNTRAVTIPRYTALKLDVTDMSACRSVLEDVRPDAIYHLAAITFVPDAERDFSAALAVNVGGSYNLLRTVCGLLPSCKFLLISSSEVYGNFKASELPLMESTPPRPNNNYGLSKLMAEMVVQRLALTSNVKTIVVRAFNHIGPGQRSEFVVSSFARQLAQIAKKEAPPLIRVGNLEALRDFTDVRDIVRGYRLAVEKGAGLYNLCSGKAVSIRHVLDTLIEISGLDVAVENDPARMRPSDVPEIRGSNVRARDELGWQPSFALQDSLRAAYEVWLNS